VVLLLFELHHWRFTRCSARSARWPPPVALFAPGAIAIQAGVAVGYRPSASLRRPYVSRIVHARRAVRS